MTLSRNMVGLLAGGLRKFAGQVAVSVAATVCATAIYGHIVAERGAGPGPTAASIAQPDATRVDGGVIDTKTLAYYPEHLAAMNSLSHFRPVSVQRTAELAGASKPTQTASLADAARPLQASRVVASHSPASVEGAATPRALVLAQVTVLPPRRPGAMQAALPAPLVVADAAPLPSHASVSDARAKLWGMELPRFVPTGSAVMDRLASVKDKIGGLMHVSSR